MYSVGTKFITSKGDRLIITEVLSGGREYAVNKDNRPYAIVTLDFLYRLTKEL